MNQCDDCTHWASIDATEGYCKRYPPTFIDSNGVGFFPKTANTDLCGEFVSDA